MFLWDENSELMDCNEAAVRILKAESREWLLAQRIMVADLSPPEQPDGSVSKERAWEIINAMRTGTPARFEWVHVAMDGTLLHVEVQATVSERGRECVRVSE